MESVEERGPLRTVYPKEIPFELSVESTVVHNSTMALSWSLSSELIGEISSKAKPAFIVLITCEENGRNEQRRLIPIQNKMTFVTFDRPGTHKIFGFVIWGDAGDIRSACIARSHGAYRHDFIATTNNIAYMMRECVQEWSWSRRAELTVSVPSEAFAREPSDIEKRWVNRLFVAAATDQCHFRRRRLFAYTIQPIILLGFTAFWSVVSLAVLLGGMKTDAGFLLHPLKNPLSPPSPPGDPILWPNQDSDFGGLKRALRIMFSPTILLGVGSLGYLTRPVHHLAIGIAPALEWSGSVSLIIPAMIGVSWMAAITLAGAIKSLTQSNADRRKIAAEAKVNPKPPVLTAAEISALSDEPYFQTKMLPARNRTIYLRYQELKAKVCRSFLAR